MTANVVLGLAGAPTLEACPACTHRARGVRRLGFQGQRAATRAPERRAAFDDRTFRTFSGLTPGTRPTAKSRSGVEPVFFYGNQQWQPSPNGSRRVTIYDLDEAERRRKAAPWRNAAPSVN